MTQLHFNLDNLTTIFRELGLYNPKNNFYKGRDRKHQQILAYIPQLQTAFSKLSAKRQLVLLDCGCGKSYLSFIVYHYFHNLMGRDLKIIGVDRNSDVINKCQNSAANLGFENMYFYCADIEQFELNEELDIIYSLHACDTATDRTIFKGVNLGAKYIFSVSCCQHTNRDNMRQHPLTSISRHKAYKERLADMIGDSMRALLLENLGYGVDIFEFVTAEQTPKNIMLRAVKNRVKKQDKDIAMARYKDLANMFNFEPALEKMLINASQEQSN